MLHFKFIWEIYCFQLPGAERLRFAQTGGQFALGFMRLKNSLYPGFVSSVGLQVLNNHHVFIP